MAFMMILEGTKPGLKKIASLSLGWLNIGHNHLCQNGHLMLLGNSSAADGTLHGPHMIDIVISSLKERFTFTNKSAETTTKYALSG